MPAGDTARQRTETGVAARALVTSNAIEAASPAPTAASTVRGTSAASVARGNVTGVSAYEGGASCGCVPHAVFGALPMTKWRRSVPLCGSAIQLRCEERPFTWSD